MSVRKLDSAGKRDNGEGVYQLRGNYPRDAEGKYRQWCHTGRFASLDAAKAKALQLKGGAPVAAVRWADAMRRWRENSDGVLSEGYIVQVQGTVSRLVKFLGDTAVESTSLPDINRFLDTEQAVARSRARKAVAHLRTIAQWLVGRGEIQPPPALNVAPRPYKKKERPPAPIEHVLQLAEALPPNASPLWDFITLTGCRLTAASLARKDQIRDGHLHLPGKGGKETAFHLSDAVQAVIDRALAQQNGHRSPHIFINSFGRPWSRGGFALLLRQTCDKLGLPHVSAHQVRHMVATIAARTSGTMGAQRLLNHASAATTGGYLHPTQDDADAAQANVLKAIARAQSAHNPPPVARHSLPPVTADYSI